MGAAESAFLAVMLRAWGTEHHGLSDDKARDIASDVVRSTTDLDDVDGAFDRYDEAARAAKGAG